MANGNLHKAKEAKNDEFYTMLTDIEKELKHYKDHFKGKVVYCNCDDCYESNFFKYFALNFNHLGLKKLVATCFDGSKVSGTDDGGLFSVFLNDSEPTKKAYKIEINEFVDIDGDGDKTMNDIIESLKTNTKNKLSILNGNGSYDSEECIEILKEADIVVTNPPFSCYSEDTEVFTDNGWKLIKNVDINTDKIYSLNPDTNEMEFVKAVDFLCSPVRGKLNHFHNSNMDFCVTDNHRMVNYRKTKDGNKQASLIEASEIKPTYMLPLVGFKWTGNKVDEFILPKTEQVEQYTRKSITVPEKHIDMKDWLEFFGFWLADGCYKDHINANGTRDYTISIKQNNKNEQYVLDLIKRIGFSFTISRNKNGNDNYNIYSKQLWEYLSQFGRSTEKYIPREFLDLDIEYLKCLFDGYLMGDGALCSDGSYHFSSVSKRLIENIQELILKIYGEITQTHERKRKHSYDDNYGVCYEITKRLNAYHKNFTKYGRPDKVEYNSNVYCLTLKKNHIMLTRHNGIIGWCGNCFRDFVATLEKYEKKYLLIGNSNAITYKEIFPLLKENKMWLGNNYVKEFRKPDGTIQKFGNICWFTNLEHDKRNEEIILYKKYNEKEYHKYDNYDAWNVDKVADIPEDDYFEMTVSDEEYNQLKATYGDDCELVEIIEE